MKRLDGERDRERLDGERDGERLDGERDRQRRLLTRFERERGLRSSRRSS